MSERAQEILALLAELDLSAAQKAHGKLMAAEAAAEINEASRAYARCARSVRQTLALQSRLTRDHAQLEHWRKSREPPPLDPKFDEDLNAVDLRVAELQDAVGRVAYNTHGESRQTREALDRFDRELDDWVEAPDFLDADFDEQVLRAARLLGLPEDLAKVWTILKRLPNSPDPVGRCAKPRPEVVYRTEPPTPRRDSG